MAHVDISASKSIARPGTTFWCLRGSGGVDLIHNPYMIPKT